MQQLELLKKYAESWNTLDVSHVEPYFADDVTVFAQTKKEIVALGKTEVVNGMRDDMTYNKREGTEEKIYAEIGFCSAEMVEQVELFSKIQPSIPLPRIEINQPCIIFAKKN